MWHFTEPSNGFAKIQKLIIISCIPTVRNENELACNYVTVVMNKNKQKTNGDNNIVTSQMNLPPILLL